MEKHPPFSDHKPSEELDAIIHAIAKQQQLLLIRVQAALDTLANQSFESKNTSIHVSKTINALRKALGARLRLKTTKQPVYLRCAHGPRSTHGTFQAVSADSKRTVAYSGKNLPPLEVFIPGKNEITPH